MPINLFDCYGHIHVYSPRVWVDEPMGTFILFSESYSVPAHFLEVFRFNISTNFCIQYATEGDLAIKKVSHPTNFVELHSPILHAKF